MTKIHNECSFMSEKGIAIIEERYNAKYVFESCIKDTRGNWCDWPSAIFYTETPHPEGSNYFAIYYFGGLAEANIPMIANGISAVQSDIYGIDTGDGIIYSRYRHDYRVHNECMVDGGRDYLRSDGNGKSAVLRVVKDKLVKVVDYAYDTGLPLQ